MRFLLIAVLSLLALSACAAEPAPGGDTAGPADSRPRAETNQSTKAPFSTEKVAKFDEPWAMTFLPDGRALVTEKSGALYLVTRSGDKFRVSGVPEVDYGGQGGLGDIILHPGYERNGIVYLSYVEAGDDNTRGAAVARAALTAGDDGGALNDVRVIWRQQPKVSGRGHYGHRLAFDDDGYLFVSSGERQKFTPSQDMQQNLGKILRLNDDGSIPPDNPYSKQGGVAAEVWSLGHRNPLGLAFDNKGDLWNHEMGPKGGDELNLVEPGGNYGYPIVSNGDHYDDRDIPDHYKRPEFVAPKAWWTPVISPGGLMFYSGEAFPDWQGDALIAGLSAQALIRIEFDGDEAREAARYPLGHRIREVEQGPDGHVWLLQNKPGLLLKLTPR